jgi:hypothetical protein
MPVDYSGRRRNNMASRLKAEIVERVEALTARQQHSKHVSAATENDETTEYAVFYVVRA